MNTEEFPEVKPLSEGLKSKKKWNLWRLEKGTQMPGLQIRNNIDMFKKMQKALFGVRGDWGDKKVKDDLRDTGHRFHESGGYAKEFLFYICFNKDLLEC